MWAFFLICSILCFLSYDFFIYKYLTESEDTMRFATIISSSIIPILVTSLTVVVNPFPAPRNITWGSSGPIIVLDLSLQLNGDSDEITRAFERCWKTINHLKWYPAAIEKPIPTYTTSRTRKENLKPSPKFLLVLMTWMLLCNWVLMRHTRLQ